MNYLSCWKAREFLFFGLVTGLLLIGLLHFPLAVKACFFLLSSIFRELNDKKESSFLPHKRVLQLEARFVEYEKAFASIFGNISFKPNNHRTSHIFRQVIMFGRPFNFSMFSFQISLLQKESPKPKTLWTAFYDTTITCFSTTSHFQPFLKVNAS